jgi:hypothetical protein
LTPQEIETIWPQAKLDVTKDLRSPVFRRTIMNQARAFMKQLEAGTYLDRYIGDELD